ncbi:MAG: hypothetical protein QOD76_728 [Solirubrobacteraceae bacterium]|nr:hypothetical protein [Solirubrobacteraceae bacterium]
MPVRESSLLERGAELDQLQAALDDARTGAGRLVVIEGAAGIGKTRLLNAARETAERTDMQVLTARGTELEREFPFALVRQLFEPPMHAASSQRRAELLEGAARFAAPIVGVQSEDAAHGGDPAVDPSFATLSALYWLTSNLAEDRATLLAIDDVHWADRPTLRLLKFLLPRMEDLPVLVVLAARPSEPGAAAELAELPADSAAHVLRPHALSLGAASELVRDWLSAEAHDEFCAACHHVTGGNPFMLRGLVAELAAEGSSGTMDEAERVRDVAPTSIQRAVLVRLARVPDEAQRLARAAAVLGDDVDPRQAGALAGLDRDTVALAADALAAADVLEPGRPLRFVHPLVRNAVYADLPGAEAAAAHERAARLLRDEGAEPERVALHLLVTDPAGDAGVVETLAVAAQRALDRAAPEAAMAYLRRALAEPAEAATRRELLALHAMAGFRAGDPRLPEAPPEVVIEELSADTRLLLRAAPYLVDGLFALGRGEEGTAFLKRAVELALETGDHHLALRLDAQRIIIEQLVPAEARAQFERYRGLIEPGTPGERLWLALQAWWGSQHGDSTAAEVADMAARAWEGGRIVFEDPDGMASASSILALLRADKLDLVARALDVFGSASQRTRAAPVVAGHAYLTACLAHDRGDLVTAEADARRAVEASRTGGFLLAFPIWIALLIDVLIERGELDAAEQEVEASGMTGDIPESFWFGPLLHSRGCLRLAQGRIDEGLDDLADVTRRGERDGIVRPTPHAAPPTATTALAAAGQTEAARESAATRIARARAWGTPRSIGTALRCSGIVEGGERGIELLREAVATLAGSPARLEHARALVDLGAALRRANRRADAREPLREGLALARRCGATVLAQRAHEELAATGEKLRPLVAGGADSLTPSERRIAGMAGEGMTNRAIAQALFLTIKTVETHLSNAYRKLDIRSRSELPVALAADD